VGKRKDNLINDNTKTSIAQQTRLTLVDVDPGVVMSLQDIRLKLMIKIASRTFSKGENQHIISA
jgi:hypothetical protein